MNIDQIGGIVRAVATAGLGYLAGRGIIGGDQVGVIATALGTLVVALWSAHTNRTTT